MRERLAWRWGCGGLSIIDLAGGQQPIWNETHDVAVVMNGELYNYREVRERLTRLGHKFKTQSDTEILVHAWEEWSEEFLGEIRGMFALAICGFPKALHIGTDTFPGTRSAGDQAAVLHAGAGRICVCVRGARTSGKRNDERNSFARRGDCVPFIWERQRTGHDVRGSVFGAAGASHADLCAGQKKNSANASVVGPSAESGGTGSEKSRETMRRRWNKYGRCSRMRYARI